jgi:hypothetical protein
VSGDCEACPRGADCSAKDGAALKDIYAAPGHWRAGAQHATFVSCKQGYTGTSDKDATDLSLARCCPGSVCRNITNFTHADQQCAEHYSGPLCAACAPADHVRVANACVPCPGGTSFSAAFSALALTCFVFFLAMTLALLKCATHKQRKKAPPQKLVGQVKLLILFAQLLSSMPSAFDGVPWPEHFKMFSVTVSLPFTLDIFPAFVVGGCHLSLYPLDSFLLHMLLVPMLIVMVFSAYAVTAKLPCCVKAPDAAARRNLRRSRRELAAKVLIFVVQLMYPGLAARIFSVFRCRSVEGVPGEVLVQNLNVACHTDRHAVFEALAAVFMMLYVLGVPLAVFLTLWRNRKALNDESNPEHEAVAYEFGPLYSQFEPQYWYFGAFVFCFLPGIVVVSVSVLSSFFFLLESLGFFGLSGIFGF